ncbi:MAG: hypothetical protein WBV94_25945 [Blastocatellia bacterium]
MRKLLMLVVILFCVGVMASTEAAQRQGGQGEPDRQHPCARHCREEHREAVRRCRNAPPDQREECLREAKQRLEACLRNCRH